MVTNFNVDVSRRRNWYNWSCWRCVFGILWKQNTIDKQTKQHEVKNKTKLLVSQSQKRAGGFTKKVDHNAVIYDGNFHVTISNEGKI